MLIKFHFDCLKVVHDFFNSLPGERPENAKIIVSSHNYERTPSVDELSDLVARIQATGADIVKIATTAVDIIDNARIFQVLVHSQVSNLPELLFAITLTMLPVFRKNQNCFLV